MNYLMLDKDDITKSYGKISKKELLKELGFKEYQLVSFLNNQGIFREKYIQNEFIPRIHDSFNLRFSSKTE